LPQGKLEHKGVTDGVIFMTYSLLISGAHGEKQEGETGRRGKRKKSINFSSVKSQIMTNTKRFFLLIHPFLHSFPLQFLASLSQRTQFKALTFRAGPCKSSRCRQIVKWLQGGASAEEAAPLIVLDECHKAKNLINETGDATRTGMAVVVLQDALPNAKVRSHRNFLNTSHY
jgi:hypothetical protein